MSAITGNKLRQGRCQALETARVNRLIQQDAMKKLFNLSLDMLCVADFDGCFQMINPAFEHTLGYSRQELLKTPFIEYIHPDDRVAARVTIGQLVDSESTTRFEVRYRCKDGSFRWLAWTLVAVLEERLIYGVVRDITEQENGGQYARPLQRETATAIVNELNQPLAAIVSYCGTAALLLNSLPSPPRQLGVAMQGAMEQAHRAGLILRQLQKYCRKHD